MAEDKKLKFMGIIEVEEVHRLTKEDLQNITGWITAAGMMIDAKMRVPWRDSELATFKKLDQLKREASE